MTTPRQGAHHVFTFIAFAPIGNDRKVIIQANNRTLCASLMLCVCTSEQMHSCSVMLEWWRVTHPPWWQFLRHYKLMDIYTIHIYIYILKLISCENRVFFIKINIVMTLLVLCCLMFSPLMIQLIRQLISYQIYVKGREIFVSELKLFKNISLAEQLN